MGSEKAGTTTGFQPSAHGEGHRSYGIARDGTTNCQLRSVLGLRSVRAAGLEPDRLRTSHV
jgi:hypothetical protein